MGIENRFLAAIIDITFIFILHMDKSVMVKCKLHLGQKEHILLKVIHEAPWGDLWFGAI